MLLPRVSLTQAVADLSVDGKRLLVEGGRLVVAAVPSGGIPRPLSAVAWPRRLPISRKMESASW